MTTTTQATAAAPTRDDLAHTFAAAQRVYDALPRGRAGDDGAAEDARIVAWRAVLAASKAIRMHDLGLGRRWY